METSKANRPEVYLGFKVRVLHKNSELDGAVESEVSRHNFCPSRNPKRVFESAVSLK